MPMSCADWEREIVLRRPALRVGSHPMARRERSGAGAADADPVLRDAAASPLHTVDAGPRAVLVARALATDVGAVPLDERGHA